MKSTKAILLFCLTALAGCQSQNVQETAKVEAQQRWLSARSRLVCSVGQECLTHGDLDRAASSAQEAISIDPKSLPARLLLAKVLLEKGQYVEAGAQLAQAEQMAPDNAQVHYLMGVSWERRRQFAQALQSYELARAADANNSAYVVASAEVMVQLGQPAQALELVEWRLQQVDGEPSLLSLAGELCLLSGQPQKAADYFSRALDMNQHSLTLRESLARAYFQAERYALALEQLGRLAEDPAYKEKSAWVYVMIGDCHLAQRKYGLARTAYETATAIDGADANAWCSLAQAALGAGDSDRALLAGRQALGLQENPQAAVVVACVLLKQDQPRQAGGLLEPYVQKYPQDATLRVMLGKSYQAMGQQERALACYQQALRAEPGNPLAKALLASAGPAGQ